MAFLIAALTCGAAFARFNGPSDSASPVKNVQQAHMADEAATCVLEGKIVKHIGRNRYEFADSTGTIVIDIPPHVFGQLEVTRNDSVSVTGELGGKKRPEHRDAHLRVRYIEKIK